MHVACMCEHGGEPYMLLQETALQLPRSAFLLAADLTEQVCVCVCATMRVPWP
jgi:hypothetical protein